MSLTISIETGRGVDGLGLALFELLEIVRVYSKVPGHPPDLSDPFTLRRGGIVSEVALRVHRDLAADLKLARIWGSSAEFEGQQVSGDHKATGHDVVERHW